MDLRVLRNVSEAIDKIFSTWDSSPAIAWFINLKINSRTTKFCEMMEFLVYSSTLLIFLPLFIFSVVNSSCSIEHFTVNPIYIYCVYSKIHTGDLRLLINISLVLLQIRDKSFFYVIINVFQREIPQMNWYREITLKIHRNRWTLTQHIWMDPLRALPLAAWRDGITQFTHDGGTKLGF